MIRPCTPSHCSRWARAQGHNLIVNALGFENWRQGLSVVDIDAAMKRHCTHHNSQAWGEILVRTTDLEITDHVHGHCCSRKQFVIDVKTVAMVDSNGKLGPQGLFQFFQLSFCFPTFGFSV